jgi:hypothetical protein
MSTASTEGQHPRPFEAVASTIALRSSHRLRSSVGPSRWVPRASQKPRYAVATLATAPANRHFAWGAGKATEITARPSTPGLRRAADPRRRGCASRPSFPSRLCGFVGKALRRRERRVGRHASVGGILTLADCLTFGPDLRFMVDGCQPVRGVVAMSHLPGRLGGGIIRCTSVFALIDALRLRGAGGLSPDR